MLTLTKETFGPVVKSQKGPFIVDFWATYCGPCKTAALVLDKVEKDYARALTFAKINIEENEGVAQEHSVMGLPCLVVFKDGMEVERFVGNFPEASLRRKIDAVLGKVGQ